MLERAAAMANHASTRKTQPYDGRSDEMTLEVERGDCLTRRDVGLSTD